MVDVYEYDDGLPISVIVPLSTKRKMFFEGYVLPLLEANKPIEIIVNTSEGSACKKRNEGFKKSNQPYVFFCDDDILLPSYYLQKLLDMLLIHKDAAFSYSGYHGIVDENVTNHPIGRNFRIPTYPYNPEALKKGNYISTMSLMRREVFPGFDESLKRLQDYDIWLTLLKKNARGVAVPSVEFMAFYNDIGITSNTNSEMDAINAIRNKHWDIL